MSATPSFTMRELLEAGVHYGHKTKRWDPRMAPYLFGIRNDIHIIDLQQTVPLMTRALSIVQDVVAKNGRVLFVGTKRAAQQVVAEEAKRCGQYYVNHRWLGGMLTNWKTISQSIKRLRKLEQQLADPNLNVPKKERLQMDHQREKLERSLGGIKDMGGLPDLLFVIDTNKEALAINEAARMGIPVIAVLDSNSNPDGINYPIPGNDDSTRAIGLYCRLISSASLAGIQDEMRISSKKGGKSGGRSVSPVESLEKLAAEADAAAAAAAPAAADKASDESLKKLAKEKTSSKKKTEKEKPAAEVEVKKSRKVASKKKDEAEASETTDAPAAEKKSGKKKAS